MKLCCLIGGLGFIGKHLITILAKSPRKITVVDLSKEKPVDLPPNVNVINQDFTDRSLLKEILAGVDELVYLAYATTPKSSFEDPINDIMRNLPGSITLFETALSCNVKKLIYLSSGGTVYGEVKELPIQENAQTSPISPYGITKLTIEKYALMYYRLKCLPIVILRPANAYGIGQKPFTGQGFIATAIGAILKGKDISLFGEKGTIRDYIYVSDLADAIVKALDFGQVGSIYNVGSGVGKSNRDVLNYINPIALKDGFPVKVQVLPERGFDVQANILDSTWFMKTTGWRPKIQFEEGIKLTWEWLKNYLQK